ncbi:MAG: type II toxin-antitoxin system RnlA family toxin [Methylococcales bacterium]
MNFKGLCLNRELIDTSLKTYGENIDIIREEKEKFIEYKISLPNQEIALLQVFYNKDGTTTLGCNVGKNKPLSIKISEYLKEKCSVAGNITRPSLSVNDVTEGNFQLILEFLKEECGASVSEPVSIQHGKQHKITGKQGDLLTFNLYNTKKLLIQGRPSLLYSDAIEILSGLFDYKDIINAQLKVVQVDITADEVVSELKILMPNAYGFMENKLISIISPALALRKLEIDLSDYGCFAFPALRGLEGYIKILFLKRMNIAIGKDGFGEHFYSSELKNDLKSKHELKLCHAIEKSYKYYKTQRHGLFHVDSIIETTRVISNKSEANSIVEKTIEIIEETYTSIIT